MGRGELALEKQYSHHLSPNPLTPKSQPPIPNPQSPTHWSHATREVDNATWTSFRIQTPKQEAS
jgi:hypothetical protein